MGGRGVVVVDVLVTSELGISREGRGRRGPDVLEGEGKPLETRVVEPIEEVLHESLREDLDAGQGCPPGVRGANEHLSLIHI